MPGLRRPPAVELACRRVDNRNKPLIGLDNGGFHCGEVMTLWETIDKDHGNEHQNPAQCP
jgi:hypothetical protein